MAFQEEEKPLNSSVIQLIQDFHGVPVGLHFIGVPLHLLGLVQQIIIMTKKILVVSAVPYYLIYINKGKRGIGFQSPFLIQFKSL